MTLPAMAWLEANYQASLRAPPPPPTPEQLEANYQASLAAAESARKKDEGETPEQMDPAGYLHGYAKGALRLGPALVTGPAEQVAQLLGPTAGPIGKALLNAVTGLGPTAAMTLPAAPAPAAPPNQPVPTPMGVAAMLGQRQQAPSLAEAANAAAGPAAPESPGVIQRALAVAKGLIPRPDLSIAAAYNAPTPEARGEATPQAMLDALIPAELARGGVQALANRRIGLADQAAASAAPGVPPPAEPPAISRATPEPGTPPPVPIPTAGDAMLGPGIPTPPPESGGPPPPMQGPAIPMGPVPAPAGALPPAAEPAGLLRAPTPDAAPGPIAAALQASMARRPAALDATLPAPAEPPMLGPGGAPGVAELLAKRRPNTGGLPEGFAGMAEPNGPIAGPHLPAPDLTPAPEVPSELPSIPRNLAKATDAQVLDALVSRLQANEGRNLSERVDRDVTAYIGNESENASNRVIRNAFAERQAATIQKLGAEVERRGLEGPEFDAAYQAWADRMNPRPATGPFADAWMEAGGPEPTWRPGAAPAPLPGSRAAALAGSADLAALTDTQLDTAEALANRKNDFDRMDAIEQEWGRRKAGAAAGGPIAQALQERAPEPEPVTEAAEMLPPEPPAVAPLAAQRAAPTPEELERAYQASRGGSPEPRATGGTTPTPEELERAYQATQAAPALRAPDAIEEEMDRTAAAYRATTDPAQRARLMDRQGELESEYERVASAPAGDAREPEGAGAPPQTDWFNVGQGGKSRGPRPDEASLFTGPQENLLGEPTSMRESDVGQRPIAAPQGMTEALAQAQRVLADPSEQYLNKVGQPTPRYLEAESLLQRNAKIGPEELQQRAADVRGTPAGPVAPTEGQETLFGQGGIAAKRGEAAPKLPPPESAPLGRVDRTGSAGDGVPLPLPEAPGVHSRTALDVQGIGTAIQRLFHPTGLSDAAEATGGTIRAEGAKGFRGIAQATHALRDLSGLVGNLSKADAVNLWDAAEHWGDPAARKRAAALDPRFPAMIDQLHEITEGYSRQLSELGILEPTIEHYVGRFWATPRSSVADVFRRALARRPLEGAKSFAKERTFENFVDGLRAGKTPLTYNFVDAQLMKLAEMQKAIAGRRMMLTERAAGRATPVMVDYAPPTTAEGQPWVRIGDGTDPAFTIYGPPVATVKEGYDAGVREALNRVITSIPGLTHDRMVKLDQGGPGWWGYAEGPAGRRMATKFGGENTVIEHELGHILDFRYHLWDELHDLDNIPGTSKTQRIGGRVQIDKELRALADLRNEGQDVSGSRQAYVRNRYEKIANAVNALIHTPERMGEVAPNVKAALTAFLKQRPELRPILDIRPSLRLGTGAAEVPIEGMRILGHYYAPPDVAAVWNNHLSKGFRGNPLFDALLAPGQAATQLILGLSGFHATVITTEAAFSELARAAEHLQAGEPDEGVSAAARAPAVPVQGVLQGRRIREEYLAPGAHPELANTIEAMVEGGYRYTQGSELWTGERRAAFKRALQDAVHGQDVATRAWGAARAPATAVYAAIERMSDPVLGKYVPLQKANATYMRVADELSRLPEGASLEDVRQRVGDVVKEMDYRFGQVIYDNHFVHNAIKHAAQLTFLAPGWTFGTLALAGRGLADVGRIGGALARLERPSLGKSGAYWASAFAGTALMNGVLTYALTGQQPTGKDFLAFRDGTKDADGNDNRHTIPGYIMKDLYGWSHHPVNTFTNKLSPGLHWAYAVLANRDYWGDLVYDPKADPATIGRQIASFTASQFGTPLSFRNYLEGRRRGESGAGEIARNVLGITPAPREFVRTPAQNDLAELTARRGHDALTPDEKDARDRRGAIARAMKGGGLDAAALRDSVRAGAVSLRQAKGMVRHEAEPGYVGRFRALPWEDAEAVYAKGNPQEQAAWAPLLLHKRIGQVHERAAAGTLQDPESQQLLARTRQLEAQLRPPAAAAGGAR